ncbi:MAG: glycoside hydrolase family 2 TIM barrel-domain containing protein [Breznakibacter sp.]
MRYISTALAILIFAACGEAIAQQRTELNTGWVCKQIDEVSLNGRQLSKPDSSLDGWLKATVPGTVLTTLIDNHLVPDPFWGMNNEKIADIYHTGPAHYTYWFVNTFDAPAVSKDGQIWLIMRGVNYSCDLFLNGHQLNGQRHHGMFLRQTYRITPYINPNGKNRLAVVVYPPDPVGEPNGGQGGDGEIARNVAHQYVAGWDWIQPIRDRNTGIWDKVFIETTGSVNIANPHVVTVVDGVRKPYGRQQPATLKTSIEIQNPTGKPITGFAVFETNGQKTSIKTTLAANSDTEIALPDLTIANPQLWWPNGYGEPRLYDGKFSFVTARNDTLDHERFCFGIRDVSTVWNSHTQSSQVMVNGQKIFIKGGNWIVSDALLRLSDLRYDGEVRFHRDMNLNLIRVWGGALLERPEFYDACDRYGLLVMQDFWISADCNGKWTDKLKKEDQWTRRQYPNDHALFIRSAADQVKMVRNHPSLAFWCGGNEIAPPQGILRALEDSILPILDGTRTFYPYSNSDQMSFNHLGGNGDGPYTIQDFRTFWTERTFPFNSEVGSVGTGDDESLKRFIPEGNLTIPDYQSNQIDSVWQYHKDIGYDKYIDQYGKAASIRDFGMKAQLVNYNQYRALAEGFSNYVWDWYTGFMIWKTQNPWTCLRGQMYDYYLDPNACLYGLRSGAEPIHVMLNPSTWMISVMNNTFDTHRDLMLEMRCFDMEGKRVAKSDLLIEVGASLNQKYYAIDQLVSKLAARNGLFVSLRLVSLDGQTVSSNFYWLPDAQGLYSGLERMPRSNAVATAVSKGNGTIEVTVQNPENAPVAFFNRLSLVDGRTNLRILPVFYSDNYFSVLPGETRHVTLEYPKGTDLAGHHVTIDAWNMPLTKTDIR